MSNVSIAHTVATHVSGTSKAYTGQRLVRIIAKKDSAGNYASPNLTETKSVSIPLLETPSAEIIQSFMPQIVDMLSSFQDGIISDLVKDGKDTILDSDISYPSMLAWINSNAGSARVTKEILQAWFMEAYAEISLEYIATALKWDIANLSPEQETVLEQKTNILRDMFSGFSSGKYSPEDAKCKAMLKFIEFCGDSVDARLTSFGIKAKDIMEKRAEELSSNALGF